MGLFDQFPYTNFHELNLDWILKQIKELSANLTEFVKLNTIKYHDPIEWDITDQYETNTVVIDARTGNAYISVQPVPSGVDLDNTDYWSPIFNYVYDINRILEQIASANEERSTTATADRTAGTLVWLDQRLVEVTVDILAGTAYVEGTNFKYITVEEFVHEKIAEAFIAGLDAIFNDVTVNGNINTSSISSADTLDIEAETINTTADHVNITAPDFTINGVPYSPYKYIVSNFGLIGDDSTLNDTAWSDLITLINNEKAIIIFDTGTYLFNSVTIPDNIIVRFEGGVIDSPDITINGIIEAPRYQIFKDISGVTANNQTIWAYPEWFGAFIDDQAIAANNTLSIRAAIAAYRRLDFAPGVYYIDDTIQINTNNHHLKGTDNNQGVTNLTSITLNNPIMIIGDANNALSAAAKFIKVENININYLSDSTGSNSRALQLLSCTDVTVSNCWINNALIAVTASNATYCRIEHVHFTMPEVSGATVFDIPTIAVNHFANGENSSLYIDHCAASYNNYVAGSYGVHFHTSNGIADTFITDFQLTKFNYGIYMDLSQPVATVRGNQDCIFDKLIFDQMQNCITVDNTGSAYTPCQFVVSNSYFNSSAVSTLNPIFVDIYPSAADDSKFCQATFTNCQFICGLDAYDRTIGFRIKCRGLSVKGCQFRYMTANVITGYAHFIDFDANIWGNHYTTGDIIAMTTAYKCYFKLTVSGYASGSVLADHAISNNNYQVCYFDLVGVDRGKVTSFVLSTATYVGDIAQFQLNQYKNTAIGINT